MDQHPSFWGDGHDEHHVTSKSFAAMFGLSFEPAFPLCPSSRDFRGRNIFDLTFTYVFFCVPQMFLPLRKWTVENGGHIHRAEVAAGRFRPRLWTLACPLLRWPGGQCSPVTRGGNPCLVVQFGTWSINIEKWMEPVLKYLYSYVDL